MTKVSLVMATKTPSRGEWHHCWRSERRNHEVAGVAQQWWLPQALFGALVASGICEDDGGDDDRKRRVGGARRVVRTLHYPFYSKLFFSGGKYRVNTVVAHGVPPPQREALLPPATRNGGDEKRSGSQVGKRMYRHRRYLFHAKVNISAAAAAAAFPPIPIGSIRSDTLPAYVDVEHERVDLAP